MQKLFFILLCLAFPAFSSCMEQEESKPLSTEQLSLQMQQDELVDTGFKILIETSQTLIVALNSTIQSNATNPLFDPKRKDATELLRSMTTAQTKRQKRIGKHSIDLSKASSYFHALCMAGNSIEALHNDKFITDESLTNVYKQLGKASLLYGKIKSIKIRTNQESATNSTIYIPKNNEEKESLDVSYEDLLKIMQNNCAIIRNSKQDLQNIFQKEVLQVTKKAWIKDSIQKNIALLSEIEKLCAPTDDPDIQKMLNCCLSLFIMGNHLATLHKYKPEQLISDDAMNTVYVTLGKTAASPFSNARYLKEVMSKNSQKISIPEETQKKKSSCIAM